MNPKPALPIEQIAASLFPIPPRIVPIPRQNTDKNPLFFLEWDGARPDCVLKFAAPGREEKVLRDQKVTRYLFEMGFAVPQIEATQDDCDFEVGPFYVMRRLPGQSLESTRGNDSSWAPAMWERSGEFLASLRDVCLDEVPFLERGIDGLKTWTQAREQLEQNELLQPQFELVLGEVRPLLERKRADFTNFDYSAAQCVTDGISFGVVDWEYAGEGFLLQTLADYLNNASRGGATPHYAEWISRGFERIAPLSDDEKREVQIFRSYGRLKNAGVALMRGNRDGALAALSKAELGV